jgi:hypothetical protein
MHVYHSRTLHLALHSLAADSGSGGGFFSKLLAGGNVRQKLDKSREKALAACQGYQKEIEGANKQRTEYVPLRCEKSGGREKLKLCKSACTCMFSQRLR